MLLHLIVVLALAVAALYGFIGLYVVPRLARLADRTNLLIRAAQYGAAVFFVGCAMTHIALAEHVLSVPELVDGHEWAHLLPHVFQVVGGTVFASIAWFALDVRLQNQGGGAPGGRGRAAARAARAKPAAQRPRPARGRRGARLQQPAGGDRRLRPPARPAARRPARAARGRPRDRRRRPSAARS